jgi:AcrR family transcriptional regulator
MFNWWMANNLARASVRTSKKAEAHERILDGFIGLMTEGAPDLSHEAVAARAGVGRRTVYRYFPSRAALLDAALIRVREMAGSGVKYPRSADELLATLEAIYTGFDAIAPVAIMMRSTPQGRALRLAQNARRVASYTQALADMVKDLPRGDRKLATAMLQVLHTTPWLEMHDHWKLDGKQIARATGWAIRTLLKDLRERGGTPLDRETT